MNQDTLDRLYEPIQAGLTSIDDESRSELFSMIRGDFCIYCGKMYQYEKEVCHCTNDD